MSNWLLLGAAISLSLATYLAALHLALVGFSRVALQRRLEAKGKAAAGERLLVQLDPAILAISLFRTASRVAFVVLVVALATGIGETATLTWPVLVIARLISVAGLWIF